MSEKRTSEPRPAEPWRLLHSLVQANQIVRASLNNPHERRIQESIEREAMAALDRHRREAGRG